MFDYTELVNPPCQYEIHNMWNETEGCGVTATHCVWWSDDGKKNVCKEHFEYIKKCEEVKGGKK